MYIYNHIFFIGLVTGGSNGMWDSNPYCWRANYTYDACCGDTLNGLQCFDHNFSRESCCDIREMGCWSGLDITWDECCRKALPNGKKHCFGDDTAKGQYCCMAFINRYLIAENTERNKFARGMVERDKDNDVEDLITLKKNGYHFNVTRTGHDTFWINMYKHFEVPTFRVFDNFVSPEISDSGDGVENRRAKVAWDIGAWIGDTGLYLAEVADHVLVLEAAHLPFAALVKNIRANPRLSDKITPVNKALGRVNKVATISNKGWAMDRIIPQPAVGKEGFRASTDMVTPEALLREYPILNSTVFIKIDVEGYEVELVPALESFIRRLKPRLFLSLHAPLITLEQLVDTSQRLLNIFPHLYEVTKTSTLVPFNFTKLRRLEFKGGPNDGTDILGMWSEIPVEKRDMKQKPERR